MFYIRTSWSLVQFIFVTAAATVVCVCVMMTTGTGRWRCVCSRALPTAQLVAPDCIAHDAIMDW